MNLILPYQVNNKYKKNTWVAFEEVECLYILGAHHSLTKNRHLLSGYTSNRLDPVSLVFLDTVGCLNFVIRLVRLKSFLFLFPTFYFDFSDSRIFGLPFFLKGRLYIILFSGRFVPFHLNIKQSTTYDKVQDNVL